MFAAPTTVEEGDQLGLVSAVLVKEKEAVPTSTALPPFSVVIVELSVPASNGLVNPVICIESTCSPPRWRR